MISDKHRHHHQVPIKTACIGWLCAAGHSWAGPQLQKSHQLPCKQPPSSHYCSACSTSPLQPRLHAIYSFTSVSKSCFCSKVLAATSAPHQEAFWRGPHSRRKAMSVLAGFASQGVVTELIRLGFPIAAASSRPTLHDFYAASQIMVSSGSSLSW